MRVKIEELIDGSLHNIVTVETVPPDVQLDQEQREKFLDNTYKLALNLLSFRNKNGK
jgi:hypothetical protein